MKGRTGFQYTMKELVGLAGHSWYPEGLQILFSRTGIKKPAFQHPFRFDAYWVILVQEDSFTINLNDEDYVLKENDLLVIHPDALRQSAGTENTCTGACVSFTADFLLQSGIPQRDIHSFEYLSSSPLTQLSLTSEDATKLLSLITMLHEKNFSEGDHPFAADVVRHFFNVFQFELAGLYHKYTNRRKVVHDRKEELLWRFLAMLPEHVKTERNLQFYANRLYVTPKYLTQTVKKISGQTAGKYIDNQVIVEAKNLLRDHTLTIAQVADQLYFSDQFFFSKFFKRYTGITPSHYRKSA